MITGFVAGTLSLSETYPTGDERAFQMRGEAEDYARELSEAHEETFIGVWQGEFDASYFNVDGELLAIAFQGEVYRKADLTGMEGV